MASSTAPPPPAERTVGLLGATSVGVGAIVGGGILVLAGVAFGAAGPSAVVAFALNGFVAVLTALSFAEMSTTFPESGGAYTFAKKVLDIRAAFGVGWVLWFAYIVAGVLYALGFAEYARLAMVELARVAGVGLPDVVGERGFVLALAVVATGAYALSLLRQSTGGGQWATYGKVVVFLFLILAGVWAIAAGRDGLVSEGLTPFFAGGAGGLVSAMGFTFIAMQGFDLVSAIAGEVKEPERNIPRAMLFSLGLALVVYIPFLLIVSTAGVPEGADITTMSREAPETITAVAVRNYLGPAGFWLVMVAAVLSTLSALQASLLAASRVAFTMARDRTLPAVLSEVHPSRGTPIMAVLATALALVAILFMVPDLAAAGAAASLIFLVSFALAHVTAALARVRGGERVSGGYRSPWFPLVPAVGGVACVALALFQAVAVPSAGAVAVMWLALGGLLYAALFRSRARAVDARAEAADPNLLRMRGRSPLVLVSIANPRTARNLISLGNALSPPEVGRVLMLTVVRPPEDDPPPPDHLDDVQAVQRTALLESFGSRHQPEALLTVAAEPWEEIVRVAKVRECETVVLGLTTLEQETVVEPLERLISDMPCDAAVLAAPLEFELRRARRILVPLGGRGKHDALRARLLGALSRTADREVSFVGVVPPRATDKERAEVEAWLSRTAGEEVPAGASVEVLAGEDPAATIAARAADADLVILGMVRAGRRRAFGDVGLRIARQSPCATLMLTAAPRALGR